MTIIILVGTNNLVQVGEDLWQVTPLLVIPIVAFFYFGFKSVYAYFIDKEPLTKKEAFVSTGLGFLIPGVVWLLLVIVLSSLGADLDA